MNSGLCIYLMNAYLIFSILSTCYKNFGNPDGNHSILLYDFIRNEVRLSLRKNVKTNNEGNRVRTMAQKTADLQEKIYILHEKLQDWAKQLPLQIQQRMSCELLANLASYLLNDPTIFEIVNSLLDIQHIIEKELFHERIELKNKQVLEHELLETMGLPPDEYASRKDILVKRHAEELKEFDVSIIMKLDQKVTEQQMVLETAGLPSFRVTNNPLEIQVQMCLLDFIIRSGKMIYQL